MQYSPCHSLSLYQYLQPTRTEIQAGLQRLRGVITGGDTYMDLGLKKVCSVTLFHPETQNNGLS